MRAPSRWRLLSRSRRRDEGAAAVEFALLLPLLIMFLFGIIQYGYGLFQLQAFNSALGDASRLAATGISDCGTFNTTLQNLVGNDGIDADHLISSSVSFVDPVTGNATGQAQPLDLVKVTASYKPFKIGIPGVPFPDTITRSQTVPIQDVGLSSITSCAYTNPAPK